MEITFNKHTKKEEIVISIIPTIILGKDDGTWSLVVAWLYFSIVIDF